MLSTHDKTTIPCLFAEKTEITDSVAKYQVILINEGQFFEDLVPWVENQLKEKKVYVCGLDGDFQRTSLEQSSILFKSRHVYKAYNAMRQLQKWRSSTVYLS